MESVSVEDSSLHLTEELRCLLSDDNFEEESSANVEEEDSSDVDVEPALPDHKFEIRTITGKTGAMQGKITTKVSLIIKSHIFRKRKVHKSGVVVFTCNGCEADGKYVSALANVENDKYQLIEAPPIDDHACWASGHQPAIKMASNLMHQMVREDPTRSVPQIYEQVREQFTVGMDNTTKMSFLSQFPLYRNMSANLYKTRREVIPSDPKEMTDLDVNLEWFHYSQNEMVVKGDQVLDDGKRILLFSSNDHLDLLARAKQVLGDGTFKITPKLWYQTFIIQAQVCEKVFVPVAFCLLPDKKKRSYSAMFSLLKEALECRGLELSAEFFMSDFEIAIRDTYLS